MTATDYNSLAQTEINKPTSPYVNTYVTLWSGIMTQFKLTRGRHFYHSEMGKHHFTVENAWHTAPTQGGGPCHQKWKRPVECPLRSMSQFSGWPDNQAPCESQEATSWEHVYGHAKSLACCLPCRQAWKSVEGCRFKWKLMFSGNGDALVWRLLSVFDSFASLVSFWATYFCT